MSFPSRIELACVCVLPLLTYPGVTNGQPRQDLSSVPMLLELDLDHPTSTIHENWTFTVRIVNPNNFAVELRGFEMESYIEPEVYVILENGRQVQLRYHATDSAWTKAPVHIPPGGAVEKHRFLWNDNIAATWWPKQPGTYALMLKTHLSTVLADGELRRRSIEWDHPIAMLRVLAPNALDRQASAWLLERFGEQRRRKSVPGVPRDVTVERVRMYDEFLSRFADSSYAPAIRWETVKLLLSSLGNDRVPDDEVPQMVDLFDECIRECLDKGGAYAEEFVQWDMGIGGNRPMALAIKYGKMPLADRIVEELDKHHPEDEAAKLWRHAHLAGYEQSGKAARDILESIIKRFPDSRYANPARNQIKNIDLKAWPRERPR